MAWRTTPLPPGWSATRRRILERDGWRCTAAHHHPRCDGVATDVDHITPAHLGGGDDDANLTSLSAWCHRAKTASEASAAARARTGTLRRPREGHAGLL